MFPFILRNLLFTKRIQKGLKGLLGTRLFKHGCAIRSHSRVRVHVSFWVQCWALSTTKCWQMLAAWFRRLTRAFIIDPKSSNRHQLSAYHLGSLHQVHCKKETPKHHASVHENHTKAKGWPALRSPAACLGGFFSRFPGPKATWGTSSSWAVWNVPNHLLRMVVLLFLGNPLRATF